MKFSVNTHADNLILQTRAHHVQLSSMADVKASMLITLSSVLLTLSVPRVQKEGEHWALLVLMLFSLTTILLASYAVMPKYEGNKRHATDEKRPGSHFNILFYGHFSEIPYADFRQQMEAVLTTPDLSYEAQLREIHSLGVALAFTKYRYLRLAYVAFILGLVVSFLTYLIAR